METGKPKEDLTSQAAPEQETSEQNNTQATEARAQVNHAHRFIYLYIVLIMLAALAGLGTYWYRHNHNKASASLSATTTKSTNAANPYADWRSYNNNGISFEYPSGWQAGTGQDKYTPTDVNVTSPSFTNSAISTVTNPGAPVTMSLQLSTNSTMANLCSGYTCQVVALVPLKNSQLPNSSLAIVNQTSPNGTNFSQYAVVGNGTKVGDTTISPIKFGSSGIYIFGQLYYTPKGGGLTIAARVDNTTTIKADTHFKELISLLDSVKFSNASVSTDPYAGWKMYTSKLTGASMKYPSDWTGSPSPYTMVADNGAIYETMTLSSPYINFEGKQVGAQIIFETGSSPVGCDASRNDSIYKTIGFSTQGNSLSVAQLLNQSGTIYSLQLISTASLVSNSTVVPNCSEQVKLARGQTLDVTAEFVTPCSPGDHCAAVINPLTPQQYADYPTVNQVIKSFESIILN